MKYGFDNNKYLKMQSEHIRDRIAMFGDKLYLEFGGKLFDDYHASRVLPGFEPDSKFKMLYQLREQAEIVLVISAPSIERNKIRMDSGLTYDAEVLRLTASGPKNPARSAGIKIGDVLLSIDGTAVNTTEKVAELIETAGNKTMSFHIRRDNIAFDVNFRCEKSVNENRWKAGLWVRDSSAGIGTLTFYVPGSDVFAGLGHAVCDVDTGDVLPLSTGEVVPARIYSVVKGLSGDPGELRGGFERGSLGNLTVNGETGIYGRLSHLPVLGDPVPVAMKQQVKTGRAQILTTIDGTEPELYDIEIDQVRFNDSSPTRNMVIIITDERLLAETGGIVQGMSGSPILQDGKLIGAVTHVFVNEPTKGFAIFAENMLKTANTVANQQQTPAA